MTVEQVVDMTVGGWLGELVEHAADVTGIIVTL
jgi:hypothetical protein